MCLDDISHFRISSIERELCGVFTIPAWQGVMCRGTDAFLIHSSLFAVDVRTVSLIVPSLSQRDREHVKALSDRLINKINAQVEHVIRNGDASGYPGCVNLSFAYVEGESLLMALKVGGHCIRNDPP